MAHLIIGAVGEYLALKYSVVTVGEKVVLIVATVLTNLPWTIAILVELIVEQIRAGKVGAAGCVAKGNVVGVGSSNAIL